jgi:hypothetical protein
VLTSGRDKHLCTERNRNLKTENRYAPSNTRDQDLVAGLDCGFDDGCAPGCQRSKRDRGSLFVGEEGGAFFDLSYGD